MHNPLKYCFSNQWKQQKELKEKVDQQKAKTVTKHPEISQSQVRSHKASASCEGDHMRYGGKADVQKQK